jgi:hypothetical protein
LSLSGNRQPKATHIGMQNGPTWGQMYTAWDQSVGHHCIGLLLFLERGLATVCPPSETEAGSAETQPARDSSADGAPMVHLFGPRLTQVERGPAFSPIGHRSCTFREKLTF